MKEREMESWVNFSGKESQTQIFNPPRCGDWTWDHREAKILPLRQPLWPRLGIFHVSCKLDVISARGRNDPTLSAVPCILEKAMRVECICWPVKVVKRHARIPGNLEEALPGFHRKLKFTFVSVNSVVCQGRQRIDIRCWINHFSFTLIREWSLRAKWTPGKYASLPCEHLDFESAVTAQNDEFKAVLTAHLHVRWTSTVSQETK